jgi:protein SCO1
MKLKAHAILALVAIALAGCTPGGSDSAAKGRPPLAGARIGGPFTLTDQNGRIVRDSDFAGKYRIVYFGYTFCPDVCPTDVQNLAMGLKLVDKAAPDKARKIVPIFITVDPERDTPAVLKQWLAAFDPRFVGLSGTPAITEQVAKEFAVYYKKGDVTPAGGYVVSHSRMAYLFGPDGAPIALLPQDGTPDAVAAEIERWVS